MAGDVKTFVYDTSRGGACCTRIEVALRQDVIDSVRFIGGCDGNHKGIQALVRGRPVGEVIELLSGTGCGGRGTSCPDQLAKALQAARRA